jgi:hypothetical protein
VSDEKASADRADEAALAGEVTDELVAGKAGHAETAAASRRRGRHRRARNPRLAVLTALAVVLALATTLALSAGTSDDSTSPAPRSSGTVPQPGETPTFEGSLTRAATPTASPTSPSPKPPFPTAADTPPAVAGPVEKAQAEPVEPSSTTSTETDQPPGHTKTAPGKRPTAPPGQDRKSPQPEPADVQP